MTDTTETKKRALATPASDSSTLNPSSPDFDIVAWFGRPVPPETPEWRYYRLDVLRSLHGEEPDLIPLNFPIAKLSLQDLRRLPTSSRESGAKNLKYFFTGVPCKLGHLGARDLSSQCIVCKRARTNRWKGENQDKVSTYAERYRSEMSEEQRKRYQETNRKYRRKRYAEDPEFRARKQQEYREWLAQNPEKARASAAKSRAKNPHKIALYDLVKDPDRGLRVPGWIEVEKTRSIYLEARQVGDEVDHIMPLLGDVVSGLHVPENLQLLPMAANRSKASKISRQELDDLAAEDMCRLAERGLASPAYLPSAGRSH